MQKRCKRLRIPPEASIDFQFGWPPLDKDGMEKLKKEIRINRPDVIIIDTFSRALSKADQMDIQEMNNIVGQLQRMAVKNNIAIILIDHQRKSANNDGNPIDDVLGSTGKSAPADAVLGLYRTQGGKQIKLKVVSRDEEEKELILISADSENAWVTCESTAIRKDTRANKVLATVNELISAGTLPTTTNIANQMGQDKSNVSTEIQNLVEVGQLIPGPKYGREQPYYPKSPSINNNNHNNNQYPVEDPK